MYSRLTLAFILVAGLAVALALVFILTTRESDSPPAVAQEGGATTETGGTTETAGTVQGPPPGTAGPDQADEPEIAPAPAGEPGVDEPAPEGLVDEVDGEVRLRSASSEGREYDPSCINRVQHEYDCYEVYLLSILKAGGGTVALQELQRLSDENSFVRSECHPLTHSIGRAAWEQYGSYQAAVTYEDGTCWSGYTHGVLERLLFKFSDDELIVEINNVCEEDPVRGYDFDYYNCVHGLGHGVSWRFDNGVFEALPFCDALEGNWEKRSCYSGVFMQNIVVDGEFHKSRELRSDEPMYPCTVVEKKYKHTCYLMQTSYALRVVGYDYAKGFELCDTEADPGYEAICYRSMGRDISGNSHRDPERVVELCSLGRPDRQGACYAGAAKNAVFNDHGVEKADALCAIVPEPYVADCEQAREEAARTL